MDNDITHYKNYLLKDRYAFMHNKMSFLLSLGWHQA